MNSQFDSANNNNSNNRVKQQLNAKWNRVDDASGGPTPRPRHGHRGVAIKELMLVFGGGNEGIVDELHVYDVAKNKWFVPVVRGDVPRGFAAYGMVSLIGQGKVFIFGGMVEYGKYSNDIYELQTTRWEWRNLRVRPAQNTAGPCPRLGHSFTLGLDYYAYVFGGLANESADPKMNQPRYLNDLYVINLGSPTNSLYWEYIETNGISPPPRESHSAVHFVTSNGKEQLIIYGGMDGQRMNDVWILDLMNMNWSNPLPHGMTPLPRSLHTANVIGNRMFIFGGWVPMEPQDKIEHPDREWKCTNTMAVLNLNSLTWEQPAEPTTNDLKGIEPGARAGHSAVVINKRVYIWSGRDGYKKTWNSQVCCDDMWYLEVDVPAAPAAIQLVRASVNSLEIQWPIISNAEQYLLQIQKVEQQEDQKVQTGRRIIRAAMPLTQQTGVVRMIRPGVYYRQPRPVMMVQRSPMVGGLSNSYPAGIRMSPANTMIQTQTPSPQQRVIMQKTVAGSGAESGTPQQPKIMVLQQAGVPTGQAPYVQVQSIQPQQSGSFNVLQSQAEQQNTSTYISNTTATTKTTYTAPVAPAIDQMMPTNILDEALNEAESFVDEQLQQQKQFQQDHDTTTTSNVHQNSVEKNREAEAKEEKETDAKKDENIEQFSLEQMRATPDDLKEGNDIKESDQTQQSQQENEPLSEDMPIKEGGGEQHQESSQQSDSGPTTSSEQPPRESDVSKQQNAAETTSTAVESEQETPSYASDEPVNGNKQTAAASQSLDQAGQQQPMAAQKTYPAQEEWSDVATLTENKIVVTEYSNSENQKKSLEPGVFYRFRVCAINSVGQSKWSPANNFKTCMPGFPGAPSNIKITKGPDGAHLSWEPPQTTNGQIVEYTVYLAMRSSSQPAFVPVYIGQTANCVVNHQNLNLAHIDLHPKAAIIFRIAARNEKGYGPATQVRWLQDQRPMAPMQQMAGSLKRIHPATATYQSPTMHQPQQMVHAPAGGYYAQISGPPRYVLQQSPVGISAGNVAMVQPQAMGMGQQKIQSTPTIAIQHSPVGNVYGFSSSSPQYQQQAPVQVHIQRQQQANISPQQMPHAAMIHQQQGEEGGEGMPQDEAINSGMTVREYLTGAGKKKLRMEQSQ